MPDPLWSDWHNFLVVMSHGSRAIHGLRLTRVPRAASACATPELQDSPTSLRHFGWSFTCQNCLSEAHARRKGSLFSTSNVTMAPVIAGSNKLTRTYRSTKGCDVPLSSHLVASTSFFMVRVRIHGRLSQVSQRWRCFSFCMPLCLC